PVRKNHSNIPPIKSANGVDMHRQRSGHASPTEWTCIASPSSPQSSYPLLLSRHQALCVKAIPNILPTKTANGVDMYRLTIHKSFLASPLFYHIHLPNIPPTKTANGVDMYRLTILTKIMRHIGLPIGSKDVVVNVVGGMQVKEPAADLAIAVAIASSLYESPVPASRHGLHATKPPSSHASLSPSSPIISLPISLYESPVPADTAFIGEIGLNGELRGVRC
ncbi:unnamed protein product, partial [Closterium sp. NIES-64]